MTTKLKKSKILKKGIQQNDAFDNKLVILISDLYQDRINDKEKENEVMLDKLIMAIHGKELILENSNKPFN